MTIKPTEMMNCLSVKGALSQMLTSMIMDGELPVLCLYIT